MRNVICTQTLLLTAIVLSLAAGCGQRGNYPALGSVSGKVTLDGTPVSGRNAAVLTCFAIGSTTEAFLF